MRIDRQTTRMTTTLAAPSIWRLTLLWLIVPAILPAQEPGRLSGRVTDGSGGALPGVTVSLLSPQLETPLAVTTDAAGEYIVTRVDAGTYAVRFELGGFEPRSVSDFALASGQHLILDQQLGLAPVAETVTVLGDEPPRAPLPSLLRPSRAVAPLVPVPPEALASVCGPGQPALAHHAVGHIVGHRDDARRQLFGRGDVLLLDVGEDHEIAAGQNFVVRRRFRTGDRSATLKQATFGEHATGLLQVIETAPGSSTAVVLYACSELSAGDRLEAFDALPMLSWQHDGRPDFDDPARVLFGEDGRLAGASQQMLVIDRGASHGTLRGQRLTVFRRPRGEHGPTSVVGEGVVIAVRAEASTIRLDRVKDAVVEGDLVALHRP